MYPQGGGESRPACRPAANKLRVVVCTACRQKPLAQRLQRKEEAKGRLLHSGLRAMLALGERQCSPGPRNPCEFQKFSCALASIPMALPIASTSVALKDAPRLTAQQQQRSASDPVAGAGRCWTHAGLGTAWR